MNVESDESIKRIRVYEEGDRTSIYVADKRFGKKNAIYRPLFEGENVYWKDVVEALGYNVTTEFVGSTSVE